MGEIFGDHVPRLLAAAAADPVFNAIAVPTVDLRAPWIAAEDAATNAEAGQQSATLAFTEKLLGVARKPDADTNSPLETWDSTWLQSRNAKGQSEPGPVTEWVVP